jgi:hypothetical protein
MHLNLLRLGVGARDCVDNRAALARLAVLEQVGQSGHVADREVGPHLNGHARWCEVLAEGCPTLVADTVEGSSRVGGLAPRAFWCLSSMGLRVHLQDQPPASVTVWPPLLLRCLHTVLAGRFGTGGRSESCFFGLKEKTHGPLSNHLGIDLAATGPQCSVPSQELFEKKQ